MTESSAASKPMHVPTQDGRLYLNARLEPLIERFRRHYASFDEQAYRDEERSYKDEFAQRLRAQLSREALGAWIAAGDFDAAKAAAMQVTGGSVVTPTGFRQTNNLLNQWDRLPILNAPAEAVARRLNALLYGEGEFDKRFDAWVELLSVKKPGVWPPATYFLMLHDPAQHIMVKPSQWQLFFKEVGIKLDWPTKPNGMVYIWMRAIAQQLLDDLKPLGARDLIDVQSFLWRLSYAEQNTWIFQANPQQYDLTGALEELEQLHWSVRQHEAEIKPGDTVYLWEAGARAGILAVSKVLSGPATMAELEQERQYYTKEIPETQSEARVHLQIEEVLEEPLLRAELLKHPVLKSLRILKSAQGTNFKLTGAEAAELASLIGASEGEDEEASADETEGDYTSLTEWQASIVTNHPLARRLAQAYPQWIRSHFGEQVQLRGLENQRFSVHVNGQRIIRGRLNQSDGVYVWLQRPPPELVEWLKGRLSRPASLRPRDRKGTQGWRFVAYTEEDYTLLQEATERMAETAGLLIVEPELIEPEPPIRQPQLYADADAQFWRVHFPRELWPAAHRSGTIAVGWPVNSTNQSVKRFQRIRAGDRVVAYVQGGVIGGVGVVTQPFDPESPRAGLPIETLGDEFTQYIRVTWADAPSEPADIFAALRHPHYTGLYNKIKNINTVVPLAREDYVAILSLLQVDDVGAPATDSRLPVGWPQLSQYVAFVRSLGGAALDAEALFDAARQMSVPVGGLQDAEDFVAELLQLRLISPMEAARYRAQPYVDGDETALLRLCALALLVPVEGSADQYLLPARSILPRFLTVDGVQPARSFAPELGVDGIRLLGWYAEAGIMTVDAGGWSLAPDGFSPLPDDDPASIAANQFVAALTAELEGRLAADLPHVTDELPLRAVPELDARLRELGQELLIDTAVVRRVYRSLLAGRHVVLSGPPGTGKTELARRLPSLLWREAPQTFQRITVRPELPPLDEVIEQRHGYAPIVVTATEDWGVRDVVGGIGPRLDAQSGRLSYTIEHGALTRVVLQHYAGTESGRRLPVAGPLDRRDYRHEDGRRYRGAWLVIDEFTRAPIDAAFGSLLTTLSGGEDARLSVPTAGGEPRELPLPRDFRIIGTLNSFDRHFLNQLSEAMKRRFDFIDVLPPPPAAAEFEQGIAAMQALRRLRRNGFTEILASGEPAVYNWPGVLAAEPALDSAGLQRYHARAEHPEAGAALDSFWRLFSAIRVFRQLGTAQIVAVYTNLLTGALVGMPWNEALDTALADALADQLQVLARDEQRVVDALIEHAGQPREFVGAVQAILRELPPGRRAGFLHALRERDATVVGSSDIAVREDAPLSDAQILRVFAVDTSLLIPILGVFRRRLRDLLGERGL